MLETSALRGAGRAAHTLARSGVDEFLRASHVRAPVYHVSSPDAVASMVEGGVDVFRGRGKFGAGFYTATQPEWIHGEQALEVVVKTEHPLMVSGFSDWQRQLKGSWLGLGRPADGSPFVRSREVDTLRAAGYDSVIVKGPNWDRSWVVGIQDDGVMVVTPHGALARPTAWGRAERAAAVPTSGST